MNTAHLIQNPPIILKQFAKDSLTMVWIVYILHVTIISMRGAVDRFLDYCKQLTLRKILTKFWETSYVFSRTNLSWLWNSGQDGLPIGLMNAEEALILLVGSFLCTYLFNIFLIITLYLEFRQVLETIFSTYNGSVNFYMLVFSSTFLP